MLIDLRSDTLTKPTPEMRRAMAEAEVGDDVYGEDPTINRLQEKAAALMGKEAALFVPSGSMGNCVSLLSQAPPGSEVICEATCHVYKYEVGSMSALGGLVPKVVPGVRGRMDPADIEKAIQPKIYYVSPTALIELENTHNVAGGAVLDLEYLAAVRALADRHGLPIHLDGARIFNAATALGVAVSDIARYADTVMFCLSKGLCAPVGSLVVGKRDVIERARVHRKRLGGGMRQAGVLAAAGLVALETIPPLLAEDHAKIRKYTAFFDRLRLHRLRPGGGPHQHPDLPPEPPAPHGGGPGGDAEGAGRALPPLRPHQHPLRRLPRPDPRDGGPVHRDPGGTVQDAVLVRCGVR